MSRVLVSGLSFDFDWDGSMRLFWLYFGGPDSASHAASVLGF